MIRSARAWLLALDKRRQCGITYSALAYILLTRSALLVQRWQPAPSPDARPAFTLRATGSVSRRLIHPARRCGGQALQLSSSDQSPARGFVRRGNSGSSRPVRSSSPGAAYLCAPSACARRAEEAARATAARRVAPTRALESSAYAEMVTPMFLAVPATIFIAASMLLVLRSGSLIFAISSSCAVVMEPTFVRSGVAEPFVMPAYLVRSVDAGGVLRMNVNERSS
mmetsp:Transcript_4485/g.11502  ORF Transcript_4485/g.11502 Transcript_4485/m.11502 type:complete len:225 (+) Transcript_4485:86-760(+)